MSCNSHSNQEFEAQTERIDQFLEQVERKIVVMSGKGGVGKSTVAANLAVALSQQGYEVGLLDVDVHGPSIAGLLGLTDLRLLADEQQIRPLFYSENLKVVTVQGLLENRDDPLICRGPFKIGMIRQFLGDVNWGRLDYLIIDSPPGTGDEPLTIAQTVRNCQAVIVTTPQEIALADVRKSIQFCQKVNLPIAGIVENMSGFICPTCHSRHDIFKSGGGEKTAAEFKLPFLGRLPIDPAVVTAGDTGAAIFSIDNHTRTDMQHIVDQLVYQLHKTTKGVKKSMKIAVPMHNGSLCAHFGHSEAFSVFEIADAKIIRHGVMTPPPHAPGVIPNWLADIGCTLVIASGIGEGAQTALSDSNVDVICGAPVDTPENLIMRYLHHELVSSPVPCNHDHDHHHDHGCNQIKE